MMTDLSATEFQQSSSEQSQLCCINRCLRKISREDAEVIGLLLKSRYPTKKMKKQFLLDFFVANMGHVGLQFHILGDEICEAAFLRLYGLSGTLFRKARRLYRRGFYEVPQISNRKKLLPESMEALSWIEIYFQNSCEKSPNSGHRYLPCFMTKEALYKVYREVQENCVSRSQFYKLWEGYYKHVSIPAESRFSKCDLCTAILEEKQKAGTSMEKKQQLDEMAELHHRLQQNERRIYYDRIQLSKCYPKQYLSIIIDSMDQNKLLLPRLSQERKSTSDAWLLRMHLIAAIVHGRTAAGAFDIFQYPHDSNLTSNFLLNVLLHVEETPPTLYLQLDNCWRENKNRFLIGFLVILVKQGVFEQIYLSFLMKGHTHEDIDQLFSIYSNDYLRNNNVLCLEDLMIRWKECLQRHKCPRQQPLHYSTSNLFNIKEWLSPHINNFHGHTGPHAFRITLNDDCEPIFKWKQWSSARKEEEAWQPSGNGIIIFKTLPTGIPMYVQPTSEKIDVVRIQNSITRMVSDPSIRLFSDNDRTWWTDFWEIQLPNLLMESRKEIPWPIDLLMQKSNVNILERNGLEVEDVDEDLQMLEQAIHNPEVQVYVGNAPSTSTQKVISVDEAILETGNFVAIFQTDIYNSVKGLPIIGKIQEIVKENGILWTRISIWQGSYTGKWKEPRKPYYEWITKKAIILYDFKLTNSNKLRTATKDKLEKLYPEYLA